MTSTLVEDFVREPGTFYLGIKGLNIKTVQASRGSKERVLAVVARHLCREFRVETCWSGSRIDPSRSALNYSMLSGPNASAEITAAATSVMVEHGVTLEKQRKDKIVAVELVFSLPPDFNGDPRAFFVDALDWTQRHFLPPMKIVAAIVHVDEASLHMHVIIVPLTERGRMDGHAVVGYVGLRNKRIDSFHKEVAQQYGLRKPRRQPKLTYSLRQQLAELVLSRLAADGKSWFSNQAAVAALRKTLTIDPSPLADALGLRIDGTCELEQTVYAVAGGDGLVQGEIPTALLCYAVEDGQRGDLPAHCADGVPIDVDDVGDPATVPDEAWVRERDDDQPPEYWDWDTGKLGIPQL